MTSTTTILDERHTQCKTSWPQPNMLPWVASAPADSLFQLSMGSITAPTSSSRPISLQYPSIAPMTVVIHSNADYGAHSPYDVFSRVILQSPPAMQRLMGSAAHLSQNIMGMIDQINDGILYMNAHWRPTLSPPTRLNDPLYSIAAPTDPSAILYDLFIPAQSLHPHSTIDTPSDECQICYTVPDRDLWAWPCCRKLSCAVCIRKCLAADSRKRCPFCRSSLSSSAS